jgi:7-keto-8-aminopelargonate synthetase-like enzyme
VAKGVARIRLMPSAIHSEEQMKITVEAFRKVGKKLGIIK